MKRMSRKEMIEASINDMVNFGETYLGEICGQNAITELVEYRCRYYKALNKEVKKRFGKIVCWDGESGIAWIA